jgi:dolichyl-diphosphooligosaccharide--protein glycosyltransferase
LAGKKNKENKSVARGKGNKSSEKKSSKPEHPISQQIGQPTEIKQTLTERLKSGAPYGALLSIIFAIALYIRAVLPHDSVFLADGTIRFGGNDPWYHMRIVEYILHNYPHSLTYDAFTEFPYGHFQHYGPLYDHTIAFISIVLGFGNPDMHLVNTVGAYLPTVLGALVVIPVYFIGKHLHNRGTGLLAALIIATLPGQFLSRSLLGFTDHHVAETLFSTATILFFMLALMGARAQNLSLSDLNRNWRAIKYPLIYAILAGVAYAVYQLCWTGAIMFGLIIMLSAIIIYIVEHIRGNSTAYITIIGVITFGLELLLILPWIHPESGFSISYSWLHVLTSLIAIVACILMYTVSREMNRRDLNPYYYPAVLAAVAILGFGLLIIVSPALFSTVTSLPSSVLSIKTGGASTIAEASSMIVDRSGNFNIGRNSMVYGNFGSCFYTSLFGILLLSYYVIRRWKPEDILMLVWTLVMLIAIYGQNRFAYYYAVNVAIMSAYFGTKVLGYIDSDGIQAQFNENIRKAKNVGEFFRHSWQYIVLFAAILVIWAFFYGSYQMTQPESLYRMLVQISILAIVCAFGLFLHKKSNIKIQYSIAFLLVILFLAYPWNGLVAEDAWLKDRDELKKYYGLPVSALHARSPGGPGGQWYNSLEWMQDNTPDTGLSYYGPYIRPPRGEPYPYPDTAYGVMSWWDYGFWIETIARRIPNANPFQEGIGGGEEQRPGAATFFTAESEAEANEIADTLGVKYVVSDVEMATGKFHAIAAWDCDTGGYGEWLLIGGRNEWVPTMRYFNSMEGRLHIFDGVSLSHYRLVHESTAGGSSERGYKWVYNLQPTLYPDLFENRHQDMPSEIAESDTGYVKIFEYVPGATISGTAPPNTTATLSIPILTNQGRTFEYVQTATVTPDGTFTLIAPYSTDGAIAPSDGGTWFDTMPSDMYTVTTAIGSFPVSVSEADVLAGNMITVQ